MVSNSKILFMAFAAIISLFFPIILYIILRIKHRASFKPVIIGALTFIVFVLVLERILHSVVLGRNLITSPVAIALYGGLAAGLFEEVGRFITISIFLKGNRDWKDGVAFGIGHGGIEAILLATFANLNNLVYSSLINSGSLDQYLNGKVSSQVIAQIKDSLVNTKASLFALGGIERICAITFHIALTLIVLYAIRNRKKLYLLLAILIHALIDFPAGLYQTHIITNIWVVEVILFIITAAAVVFIFKSKNLFKSEYKNSDISI